jgi:cupin superfamily acireductone dioxygenase involved in methionine salvage
VKNNLWLKKVKRTTKVSFRNPVAETTSSLEVEIEKYNMTHNEKLAAVVQAALKHFAAEINELFHPSCDMTQLERRKALVANAEAKQGKPLSEPVIEDKFVRLAVEGTCWIPIHSYSSRTGICEKVSLK